MIKLGNPINMGTASKFLQLLLQEYIHDSHKWGVMVITDSKQFGLAKLPMTFNLETQASPYDKNGCSFFSNECYFTK